MIQKLFPAEKDNSSNTMAKLFQIEMTKMKVKNQPSFAKEEAENLRYSSTMARKQSLLPKGCNYIILQSLTKTMKTMMKILKKDEENEEFV